MLIEMPTLTRADIDAWENWSRYDHQIGKTLDHKQDKAIHEIQRFIAATPDVVCSTSWGKDSVVVADLVFRAAPQVPIVWVPTIRADGMSYEADVTYRVRDEFLRTHPGVTYVERLAVARNPKRGDPGYDPGQFDQPGYRSQDVLGEMITEPYISGVRAEESRIRAMSIGHRGTSTTRTCRPIGRWSATEVFAYLTRHNLPVHGAYAATYGGTLDRRWLRVHPLRSKQPPRSTVYGRDMDTWENNYFPDLTQHNPPGPEKVNAPLSTTGGA